MITPLSHFSPLTSPQSHNFVSKTYFAHRTFADIKKMTNLGLTILSLHIS